MRLAKIKNVQSWRDWGKMGTHSVEYEFLPPCGKVTWQ